MRIEMYGHLLLSYMLSNVKPFQWDIFRNNASYFQLKKKRGGGLELLFDLTCEAFPKDGKMNGKLKGI